MSRTTPTAGAALRALAAAIDARDWSALAALMSGAARVSHPHSGQTFDRDGFVAFNRDYPGHWRFEPAEVVDGGRTGVLRARVTDATGASPAVFWVAVFATVDDDGLVGELVELWTDDVAGAEAAPAEHLPLGHLPLDYVEIAVSDLDRARSFYGAALGWTFNDHGPAYAGIRTPDGAGEVGGLGVGRPTGAGGVMALVRSGDLAASHAAVLAAGGSIVEEPYDYPGGRRFLCADPDGNVLGVYQPVTG